jgi:8-oxo-dGTP diphosphatase
MRDQKPVNLRCSAIIFRADTLLLCRRTGGDWVLPGGTPRFGEGTGACVIREVREETGLAIEPHRIAFVLEATNAEHGQHLIDIVFYAHLVDPQGTPRRREPDLTPQFVALREVGRLPLRPPVGGYLGSLSTAPTEACGIYLGNMWRPTPPLGSRSPASDPAIDGSSDSLAFSTARLSGRRVTVPHAAPREDGADDA